MSALLLHSSTSVNFYFTLRRFRDSPGVAALLGFYSYVCLFNGELTKSLFVL